MRGIVQLLSVIFLLSCSKVKTNTSNSSDRDFNQSNLIIKIAEDRHKDSCTLEYLNSLNWTSTMVQINRMDTFRLFNYEIPEFNLRLERFKLNKICQNKILLNDSSLRRMDLNYISFEGRIQEFDLCIDYTESDYFIVNDSTNFLCIKSVAQRWTGRMMNHSLYQIIDLRSKNVYEYIK
ncbi:MAG: hypothetical protein COA58_13065 [Bacteroidetes bacterium]|nr:MAG: hypothetical protein COA58_13065 [Bacteroidota bacterium]